jgi:hypothetical protein
MPGTARYRALGLCTACGGQREEGKLKCTKCLLAFQERHKAFYQEKIAKGLCVSCAKPNDNLPRVVCLACKLKARAYIDRQKLAAFQAYGGPRCACCGEAIFQFLTIDHINGDGASHRKTVAASKKPSRRKTNGWKAPNNGSGVSMYTWLRQNNYPPGFRVLCMNCNCAIAWFGSCPHKRFTSTT